MAQDLRSLWLLVGVAYLAPGLFGIMIFDAADSSASTKASPAPMIERSAGAGTVRIPLF